jgi:anthranilate 1,2-dioxygenase small subunit
MTPFADTDMWRRRVDAFHAAYCDTLDGGRLADWPASFTDCFYRITARENRDLGLPVGLVYCEGRAMLRDRAFAIEKTAMHAPRYLRHFVSNVRIDAIENGGTVIRARANYLLFQVLMDRPNATLHQMGEYHDVFRVEGGVLLLASRDCVYDNALIDNALVYPV